MEIFMKMSMDVFFHDGSMYKGEDRLRAWEADEET